MNSQMKRIWQPYFIYLWSICLIGIFLSIWGLLHIPDYDPLLNFLLILTLAVVAQLTTTTIPVAGQAGITFEVGTAISMASLAVFGVPGAVLIVAISSLGIWLIKPVDKKTWKRNWQQLGFNTGMWTIAMFIAGQVFQVTSAGFGSTTFLGRILPWLFAAIVNDQINLWLLLIILRLQNQGEFRMIDTWRENRWASSINILVIFIGSGLLAFAIDQFGWIGIAIFFLPITLSAYAFRLYVRQMQSHLDNLEEIVSERTQELATLVDEKDEFLGVLTHDMNTPLTNFSLFLDLLEAHPTILDDEPQLIDTMRGSHQSLVNIVNSILDLEKLKSGGTLQMKKEVFNIMETIEHTVTMMQPQATKKQISLLCQLDIRNIQIYADPLQIERILLNLISNALKYTRTAGTVLISASKENNQVVIAVKDNGYGIPQAELASIFDRFSRVKKHRYKEGGTGLGLAITKALVEAHEGKIIVTSKEDIGSTFSVLLPIYNE